MKRYLPFILIGFVAVATVTAGALLYRAKVAELTPIARDKDGKASTAGKAESKDAHIRGNAKASVTLEEFGDFQCPPCGTLSPVLAQMEHEFDQRIRVVFRNFPLAMHNHAAEAARGAEAAGLQGRFWEMHDLLYQNQLAWSKEADVKPLFLKYASEFGLDLGRFEKDYDGAEVRGRVTADQARGASLGVTSTPTLFINGQPLPPASLNENGLRTAISAAIRGETLPTATTPTVTPLPQP